MTLRPSLSTFAGAVAFAVAALIAAPQSASAQGQGMDFLWGGSDDWGGGRSSVAFSNQYKPGQVIVSFGDRRLYLVTQPGKAISYPIAVPRTQSRWQGTTFVSDKRINPAWTPTPEMIRENPRLPRWVPGGHPMNPLGVRAMYLGSSSYRIHGTDAPWTIGQAVSKGCVRMLNEDVLDLYPRVPVGARVTVTWQKFNANSVASSSGSSSGSYSDEAGAARKKFQRATYPGTPEGRPICANTTARACSSRRSRRRWNRATARRPHSPALAQHNDFLQAARYGRLKCFWGGEVRHRGESRRTSSGHLQRPPISPTYALPSAHSGVTPRAFAHTLGVEPLQAFADSGADLFGGLVALDFQRPQFCPRDFGFDAAHSWSRR